MNASLKLGLLLAVCASVPAFAQGVPRRVGQCVNTTIKAVETRLMDSQTNQSIPDSGSAVSFANGLYQVSYDTIPAIVKSQAGDAVKICLISIPKGCPKGDNRGKKYATTNLRTGATWRLFDSEHLCGGA